MKLQLVHNMCSFNIPCRFLKEKQKTYCGNFSVVACGCSRSCSCGRRLLSRRLHRCRLPHLPVGLQGGEVVDGRKLDEGGEDEGEADGDEPVHGRRVGDFGEGVSGADAECCHGEDGGDTCGDRGV